jgi:hypothetical protein
MGLCDSVRFPLYHTLALLSRAYNLAALGCQGMLLQENFLRI